MSFTAQLSVVILLFGFFSLGVAQNSTANAIVSGTVTSVDGQPVSNAEVEVHDTRTGRSIGLTYTSANGNYQLSGVMNGQYEVVARYALQQATQQVWIQGVASQVNFRLDIQQGRDDFGSGRGTVSVRDLQVPSKARQYLEKAKEAARKNKVGEAWSKLSHALEVAPDFAPALTFRAILRLDRQDARSALDDAAKAVQSDPNYPLAYVVMGTAYNVQALFNDAERVLQHAVAMWPTSWQAHFELGRALLGKKDYQSSLREITRARDSAPRDFCPLHLLSAQAHLGLKDYRAAAGDLEQFLDHAPHGTDTEAERKTLEQLRALLASGREPGTE